MKKGTSDIFGYVFVGVLVALAFIVYNRQERAEAPHCELCGKPIMQGEIEVEDFGTVCSACFFSSDFVWCPRCGDICNDDPSECLFGLCASCTYDVTYHCVFCGSYVGASDALHITVCPVCGEPPEE